MHKKIFVLKVQSDSNEFKCKERGDVSPLSLQYQTSCAVFLLLTQRSLDAAPRVVLNRGGTTGADQSGIYKALGIAPSRGLTGQGVESAILAGALIGVRSRDLKTDDLAIRQIRRDAVVGAVPDQIVEGRAEKLNNALSRAITNRNTSKTWILL